MGLASQENQDDKIIMEVNVQGEYILDTVYFLLSLQTTVYSDNKAFLHLC